MRSCAKRETGWSSSLLAVLAKLEPIDEDFPAIHDLPHPPMDL
jgi:hypothetical protein